MLERGCLNRRLTPEEGSNLQPVEACTKNNKKSIYGHKTVILVIVFDSTVYLQNDEKREVLTWGTRLFCILQGKQWLVGKVRACDMIQELNLVGA